MRPHPPRHRFVTRIMLQSHLQRYIQDCCVIGEHDSIAQRQTLWRREHKTKHGIIVLLYYTAQCLLDNIFPISLLWTDCNALVKYIYSPTHSRPHLYLPRLSQHRVRSDVVRWIPRLCSFVPHVITPTPESLTCVGRQRSSSGGTNK